MSNILLMNGGVGTELIRRGVSCPPPLWSATGLWQPEILKDIYRDYLKAGAQALITNTFRTGWQDIAQAELAPEDFVELNRRAIQVVSEAIHDFQLTPLEKRGSHVFSLPGVEKEESVLILGSIGSIADCYHPERVPPDLDTLEMTHRHQMELFAYDPRVDVILGETLGDQEEVRALLRLRNQGACCGKPLWISLLCQDADTLLDGTKLSELWTSLDDLGWPDALGFNCMAPEMITALLERHSDRMKSSGRRLLAYGHLGRRDAYGRWEHQDVMMPDQYAKEVHQWIVLGVTIVGGCCGTTPKHIRALGKVFTV